jgi:hypothetical protein
MTTALIYLLNHLSRLGSQPQRDVGWLHCLPYHLYQVVAQRLQVGFLAQLGREGFEGLSGIFDPFTTERLYFYVYVRYESKLNQCPYPPFPFPPISPIRALALAISTVLL